MANVAANRSHRQSNGRALLPSEKYLTGRQSYVGGAAAPKLQPKNKPVYKPTNKPEITMRHQTAKKGSAPKVFLTGACALLLLAPVVYAQVEVKEVTTEITKANQEYDTILNEQKRMQSELESKMSIKNVEEYAEQVLGLQKLDQSQIEYLQLQTDDIVAIPEQEKNLFIKIKDKFQTVLEYLRG